jgi:hypothetical protein
MARKLDLAQLRQAKNNQFIPNAAPVKKAEESIEKQPIKKKAKPNKQSASTVKPKPVKEKVAGKAGRPVDMDKKPTRATSIRLHPNLVEVPKILAGISRKNVFSIYNEMIVETLLKYKKKYPGLLDDLVIPPKEEL